MRPIQYLQPTSQDEIVGKLSSCVSVLKGDLESIARVGREMVEDHLQALQVVAVVHHVTTVATGLGLLFTMLPP